jgi:hypothetical protein
LRSATISIIQLFFITTINLGLILRFITRYIANLLSFADIRRFFVSNKLLLIFFIFLILITHQVFYNCIISILISSGSNLLRLLIFKAFRLKRVFILIHECEILLFYNLWRNLSILILKTHGISVFHKGRKLLSNSLVGRILCTFLKCVFIA